MIIRLIYRKQLVTKPELQARIMDLNEKAN